MGFADDHLIPLIDEGLGNSAYLLDLGNGSALAMDAGRDRRSLRAAAERRGLRVACTVDTHLHADYLSGAVQLGRDTGATILAGCRLCGRPHPRLPVHPAARPVRHLLGWLLPDAGPLAFVVNADQDLSEIVRQAYEIGYERPAGRLAGGMNAWLTDGNARATTAFLTADRAADG
ncbi:hypothetical protein ACH46L_14345 [Streptomyces althioticus]|uniref:hypothetical protein n=1 Tax=Streptomyces althioticus TaxID=83380 RepID=UPI0037B3B217